MERADFEQWKPKEVARLLALVEGGRRYYQNLVAALPVPLIVLAPDRSVVFANRAFRQAFGLRAEDLGRMSIDQILPSERLIEKIRDVHLHGIAPPGFSLEVGEKLLRIAIVPIRSLDEETEFETLLMVEEAGADAPADAPRAAPPQQIEQRQLTAARNSALQGLSARLAHDLNNPLMIITGYAEELLLGLKKDDPQRSSAEQILEATQRIAGLTAQLLQFTRKQANPPQPVDLSGVIAGLKAAQAAVNVQAGKPVWALADATQLHEILLTLVRAACEGATEPRATIACDTVSQPSDLARITVGGNGRALDAGQRAAVFEAFLAKDPEKSAGVALARAYSIVREWGGDLAVSSESSAGTAFTLYLPLGAPATAPQRETILVVDDEANIRALVAKILRREGYNVLQAGSAQEAFAVASKHAGPIHLLVTDVVLPGESGRQIAERMRQALPNLKVLYISGFSGDESVRTGNYLQKPFALGALIAKVREALDA